MHPAVPLLHGHALTIGALSYGGRLQAGIYADAEVVPDAVEVARDLERALRRAALGHRGGADAVAPARPRAPARRQRAEAVDRPVERDDVDAPARVLAERREVGTAAAPSARSPLAPDCDSLRRAQLALAEVAVDVAAVERRSAGSRTT